MVLSFDEVGAILDEIAEEFPPSFFSQLNGGILLLPEAKRHQASPSGRLHVMGEYCIDQMGRYIKLYYGSFLHQAQVGGWREGTWRRELRRVLTHEFTHHIECLAGERGLEHKDARQMTQMLEEEP